MSYSAGLLKVNTLNVPGASGSLQATNATVNNLTASSVNADNFALDNDLQIVGNLTVQGDLVAPLLTNQLESIQYAVGADPNATVSDQDALASMMFVSTFLSNFQSAMNLFLATPSSTTVIPLFIGNFNYINPTDGSGYVGEMWKGEYNPTSIYFGPSGEEMRAVNTLTFDILTKSVISISLLVKYATEPMWMNTQTSFYSKLMEEYDNPSLYVNFRASMYNKVSYLMKSLRLAMDSVTDAVDISLLSATEVLFNNEISVINNLSQLSGFPSQFNDYYAGDQIEFDAFTTFWGYFSVESLTVPFPWVDNAYLNGVTDAPGAPEWIDAVTNNSVKYFKSCAKMLNSWGNKFETNQPLFHMYLNGSSNSKTLGYTDASNVFAYYNPIDNTVKSFPKYNTTLNDGTLNYYNATFTTFGSISPESDAPFAGTGTPNGTDIDGIFTLPGNWWDWKRFDSVSFYQDFKAMYNYLLSIEGGQAIIDACQSVYVNEVLPASSYCYTQFKICKTNNLVDDEYPCSWRRYINEPIERVDVVNKPYTVYLKDGTTIPLNDPRIMKAMRISNNVLAQQCNIEPNGDIPLYVRQDSSKNYTNYTSFQNISENYAVETTPVKTVTSAMMSGADTESNSCAKAVFKAGQEFAKFFDDLESYAIYSGLENGSIQLPLNGVSGPPYLTAAQFNTDVSGVMWDIQHVYDVFLNTLGKTKSDWQVLGYYYGRHPSDPLAYVYNPAVFTGAVDASGFATDASGLTVITKRALQGGNNQFVLEGGHSGSDASGWDAIGSIYQLLCSGTGPTPYAQTLTLVANMPSPLTNYVVRANYSPETIPICLDFDYCLVEHYKISATTGYPTIVNGVFSKCTSDNFVNGTKGNTSTTRNIGAISRDKYRFRSFANQINQRVFDSWYNSMVNKGRASRYTDASGIDTSGNGMYSPNMVNWMKNNMFFMIAENTGTSAGATGSTLPSNLVASYSWYSDTFGCKGADYTGPASISGRASWGLCIQGTGNPQLSVKPQYNFIGVSHELFGHGVQFAYTPSLYTTYPVAWPTSTVQTGGGYLQNRNGYTTDDIQGTYYYAQYNSGVVFEGYATLIEIISSQFGYYRSVDLVNIDLIGPTNTFVLLYSILALSRIVARLIVCGTIVDPTCGAGYGDVTQYPWVVRTFPVIMKIANLDSTERLAFLPTQMVTYAFGLASNLEVINAIKAEKFPTNPQDFRQYNYDFWRFTEAGVLTGEAVKVAALAKPASYWSNYMGNN